MPVSFAYGRRDGRLAFVGDLDEKRDRGLACGCLCPECRRPLQAHLGSRKAWHFQHHVEEARCNPQPMTLLHAFVRDELALRKTLQVPVVTVYSKLEVLGRTVLESVQVPAESFVFKGGQVELRGDGVQPDVVFDPEEGVTLVLEVRYTHAVDEEKLRRLHRNYVKAVEFDVSDLPASGISKSQLEAALLESTRWTWLVNGNVRLSETKASARLTWAKTVWRPGIEYAKSPEVRPATQRLKQAKKRMAWAETALVSLRHQALGPHEAAEWLGEQDKVDRVAVACSALRINPERLPPFMQQYLPSDKPSFALGHHPYSWQPPIFMKFCIGKQEFAAQEASDWCEKALPDRCENEDGTQSQNGFTRTAAALHLYFLQLEAQGLLHGTPYVARGERKFTPRFESVAQFQQHVGEPP